MTSKLAVMTSAVLIAMSGGALAQGFEGKWALVPEHCAYENGQSISDEDAVDDIKDISRTRIESYASSCRITSIAGSKGSFRLGAICESEGTKNRLTFHLALVGANGLRMSDSGTPTANDEIWTRCPAKAGLSRRP